MSSYERRNGSPDRRVATRRKADRTASFRKNLWLGILTLLWVYAAVSLQQQANDIKHTQTDFISASKERRSQSCVLTERRYADEVRGLEGTYKFLLESSHREKGSTLNRTIARGLPQAEHTVRRDKAPPYCDEPGIGLREPNPVVPPRPKALK